MTCSISSYGNGPIHCQITNNYDGFKDVLVLKYISLIFEPEGCYGNRIFKFSGLIRYAIHIVLFIKLQYSSVCICE